MDKGKSTVHGERVKVEAARGSGHAWGAEMHKDNAIHPYKSSCKRNELQGFQHCDHEFGHNVETTITLHDVDNYIMHGVPNTASPRL
jgi:hypothetical protein